MLLMTSSGVEALPRIGSALGGPWYRCSVSLGGEDAVEGDGPPSSANTYGGGSSNAGGDAARLETVLLSEVTMLR
jgi:hypothetical protein